MSSTYIDGTTPLDAAHLNALQQKVEKGVANGYTSLDSGGKVPVAQLPSLYSAPSYGTSLPASPVDGQEAILVDSISNPSYQWRFRWNAGSASAYKWEFVGGSPFWSWIQANEALPTFNGWMDAPTVGPSLTIPRAGDYTVQFDCASNSTSFHMAISFNGDFLSGLTEVLGSPTGTWYQTVAGVRRVNGIAAATIVKMVYWPTVACNILYRSLSVTPVRVA